jgi:hypothetical protein
MSQETNNKDYIPRFVLPPPRITYIAGVAISESHDQYISRIFSELIHHYNIHVVARLNNIK